MSEELGLTVHGGIKVTDLRSIIEKNKHYANKELVKSLVDYVVEENKSRKEAKKTKLELEKNEFAHFEK